MDLVRRECPDLDAGRNVVDDADGLGVWVAREAVGDDVVLHLPWRLRACFLPIDGLACRALKTAILDLRTVHNTTSIT